LRYVCHLKENKNKFYTWVGKHFGSEEKLPHISLDCEFAFRRALLKVYAKLGMRIHDVA